MKTDNLHKPNMKGFIAASLSEPANAPVVEQARLWLLRGLMRLVLRG
jgi:hypothetical protein